MTPIFLIPDPYHDYAVHFIETVVERFGYEPLCVLSHRPSRTERREFPQLDAWPSAHVSPGAERAFARRLSTQANVIGAIPFSESVLTSVIHLTQGLDSSWNRPEVLTILRNKHALKEHLRNTHPELQVGMSLRVSADSRHLEVLRMPGRFVIKPNQGHGNRSVGYFDAGSTSSELEAFIRGSGAQELVLEEYLEGSEYFINGQVDGQFRSTAVAAFGYERIEANGRRVDWLTYKVAHDSSEFRILAQYAQAVVAAVGLRRSPFHLEAKILGGVPRLIELGARLAGNGNALISGRLHGGTLNLFTVAADHYLHELAASQPTLDWDSYDAADLLYVHGVSFERGLIHKLEGLESIEHHPMFFGWVRRPAVGQRLFPTVDMFSSPWCFILRSPRGLDALRVAAADLRLVLRINPPGTPLRHRMTVKASDLQHRAAGRLERLNTSKWARPL